MFNGTKKNKNDIIKNDILNYFAIYSNSTIVDLARTLDISVPTVTKLLNEMCDDGYVKVYGKLESGEGRHPNLYGIRSDFGYSIGVDIRHNAIDIGVMNFEGVLIDLKKDIPYNFQNTQKSMDDLCVIVKNVIDKLDIDSKKILSVNFNISGRVNPITGYSYSAFNFSEEPLDKVLTEKIGITTYIDNDSRAMAYGELIDGCAKGVKNVFFINLSWGLGSAIIINGDLYPGKSGFSGEIGHVHEFDNELLCHCGKKGCLETEVSGNAFLRIFRERIAAGETSGLLKRMKIEDVTLENLIDATNHGDVLCIDIVETIGRKLGAFLSGLINVLNPELVVLGGMMSLCGDFLLQPMLTAVRKYSLNLLANDTDICVSKLKDRAGIIGACMLGRRKLFI
jgi:glucokinase-like ROK family protein